MIFRSIKGETYSTDAQLGKGGEGTVFLLAGKPGDVLKVYNEQLSNERFLKLQYMLSLKTDSLENYTAWPRDIAFDAKNQPAGFVMRKLENYYPLHMLFSPMDRKRLFPDKGYNFLMHVARNLSAAFHALHQQQVIVGDINEGNILVNAKGMIVFIDCDSFQLKNGAQYYFCEVGIPRYTPPELLRQSSFNNIVRTEQTDSFSLGILIFQLLFLGRHPFAGKNNSSADIDEDTAIRNFEFAYSLRNSNKRLSPPDAAFKMQYLPATLTNLFHDAFEQENKRPAAAAWMQALDHCLKQMRQCTVSKTHIYPDVVHVCPWCDFKQRMGIVYFWDDSVMEHLQVLGDIEAFVNGFKLERLQPQKLPAMLSFTVEADPIDPRHVNQTHVRITVYIAIIAATIACFFYVTNWAPLFGILFWSLNRLSPCSETIEEELKRRQASLAIFRDQYLYIREQYESEQEINQYNMRLTPLGKLIDEYRKLPAEIQSKRTRAEEQAYNEQLHLFLRRFMLKDYKIPMFGASKQLLLAAAGIHTAADITRLDQEYVRGIGPKNIHYLKSWQLQVQSGFVYQPDQVALGHKFADINQQVAAGKMQLEAKIRQAYKELFINKQAIAARQDQLLKQFTDMQYPYKKAKADLDAFHMIARKYRL